MSNDPLKAKRGVVKKDSVPRKTKIVATVGPACESIKTLRALLREGVDVFRINTSHTTPERFSYWMDLIRKAGDQAGERAPMLVDLQGPRIRTGPLEDREPVRLRKGEMVAMVYHAGADFSAGTAGITTSCREFPSMVKKGDQVLVDNGLMDLEVLRVEDGKVQCRVLSDGVLGSNKGINLPQAPMTLPALTEKDERILALAAEADVDYVALSFVRSAEDVKSVKKQLEKYGKDIPIIAKIEKPRAVQEIDSIMAHSEGIMVARGDLGIEMGVSRVPVIQKRLIAAANQKNIGVITATQMLESMMEHPRPSRAEASDIANAVFDGTDAVMLSGETAVGKYPVEAVRMMAEIICEAEGHQALGENILRAACRRKDHPLCAITQAAQRAASEVDAKAIVAFTRSGKTAVLVSKFERRLPIVAFTPSLQVARRLALFHGVMPMPLEHCKGTDQMLMRGEEELLRSRFLKKGDAVVVVSSAHAFEGANYMVLIHWIGKKRL